MESAYAPSVHFQDEIFEYSDRAGAMNMWRTIFAKTGPDLKARGGAGRGGPVRVNEQGEGWEGDG